MKLSRHVPVRVLCLCYVRHYISYYALGLLYARVGLIVLVMGLLSSCRRSGSSDMSASFEGVSVLRDVKCV